jgi:hypothetical protein
MASVYADPKLRSKRTYIATSSFNNQLYTYTTTMTPPTYVTTGSLGAVTGATAAACPRGHLLRETGARLYPEANPGISTLRVGVYDADSGLRGYIDPNAPIFAVFNSDKPVEMVDGGDNNTATPHKGQPVYTTGDVIAEGEVVAVGQVRSSGVTNLTSITTNGAQAAQSLNPLLGQVFTIASTPPSGVASITLNAASVPAGARITLVITHTGSNATTFTFGTNMVSAGTFAPNSTGVWVISFVSDSVNFVETGRTTVQA